MPGSCCVVASCELLCSVFLMFFVFFLGSCFCSPRSFCCSLDCWVAFALLELQVQFVPYNIALLELQVQFVPYIALLELLLLM